MAGGDTRPHGPDGARFWVAYPATERQAEGGQNLRGKMLLQRDVVCFTLCVGYDLFNIVAQRLNIVFHLRLVLPHLSIEAFHFTVVAVDFPVTAGMSIGVLVITKGLVRRPGLVEIGPSWSVGFAAISCGWGYRKEQPEEDAASPT